MSKKGKRYRALLEKVDLTKQYTISEAVALAKECATAKFDESLELHVRLGVDPRHADQQVRSTIVLPHGTGHTKKVCVLALGDKQKEAQDAGADIVGGEDLVKEIADGRMDFDAVIATPDIMKSAGRLGKVLGPRGLMPSAKTGTVTFDVANAISEIKAGRVEFRVDKTAITHNAVGKASFPVENLDANVKALVRAIVKVRPAAVKGTYIKGITLATTMGVGLMIDPAQAQKDVAVELASAPSSQQIQKRRGFFRVFFYLSCLFFCSVLKSGKARYPALCNISVSYFRGSRCSCGKDISFVPSEYF